MTEEHETIDEMRADKARPSSNQDTLAIRRREKFDRRETREGGV